MNAFRMVTTSLIAVAAVMLTHQPAFGQATINKSSDDSAVKAPPSRYGVWTTVERNKRGERLETMRLKVFPAAAPTPLLRHRLVPDSAERTDGNSAPAYLKAMGFVEQTNARIALSKQHQKWINEATDEQRADYDIPPDSWRSMSPESLPLEQVKSYLNLIAFQEPLLFDAARRKNYSQDRALEREPNPIGYLLPEVQQMRELARQQILRLRYAIAQNRIDDAVEILGQLLAMANHIGQDEFFVSNLVGVSIEFMGISEGLALSQQPTAPNLYWAIAACPKPMIDISSSIETERLFLARQLPILLEVDDTVRPKEYWADFAKRMLPLWNQYASELNSWTQASPHASNLDLLQFATLIASQYEPARRFLNEVCGMSDEQLDQYPATQITFLAMVKYHEITMDEALAMFHLPYSDQQKLATPTVREQWKSRLDWIAKSLGQTTLAGNAQIRKAIVRGKQWLALWQTVEALRMTAAANDGQVPTSLETFVVPVPLDPVVDKPFEYSTDGQTAAVTGSLIDGARYQVLIEVTKPIKEKN